MKETKWLNRLLPTSVLLGLLLIWELGVRLSGIPLYILPAPTKILRAFCAELPLLLRHSSITLSETILGLTLAIILAMSIAILMDAYPPVRKAIYPLLVVTQTVPVIVLAPIFIIYLGFGMAPKILIVVLMCFFPITIPFADAMGAQDIRRIHLLSSMGAPKRKVYTLVKIPGALPAFFSGLKVSATYSISGAVVSEWLSSSAGLGYYMLRVKNGYMLDKVFASVLMVVLLSLLMNGAVKLLSRLILKPPAHTRRSSS
ncbi:MAG: transporter permease [Firmicutes bacterium]|nr:transporter permease [Bacillota bacterium]